MVDRHPRRVSPRLALALAATAVFLASVVPLPSTGDPPPVSTLELLGWDKLVHLLSYAAIALLAARAEAVERTGSALLVVVAVTGFGVCVEAAQWFVPGRTTTLGDALVNGVGAVVGVVVWRVLVRRRPSA